MKITDRGYWVSKLFYYQSLVYFFFYSLHFRSFTFFSAANPLVDLGGMLGERKSDIYRLIPQKNIPESIQCVKSESYLDKFKNAALDFPIIAKPNIGFKGFLVAKLQSEQELINYMEKTKGEEILLQEFIDLQHEFSILYFRVPFSNENGVSSFIEKVYPFVTGDGKTKLRQLIEAYHNPFLDRSWVMEKWKPHLQEVPVAGKKIILDPIGNYSRGAKFYSLNHQINDALIEATSSFFDQIEGMDFGRIDLKANSLKDYLSGNFKILEINGAKSEPLHIYDPYQSWLSIVRDIHRHWKILTKIVKARRTHTFHFPSTKTGWKSFRKLKKLTKS